MSSYSSQLQEEQIRVDEIYAQLDTFRDQTTKRLQGIRAAGAHGSPTQRSERDSFAAMYEDRLAQLRAVEDRLVFGRLDDLDAKRTYIGRIGISNERHDQILTDWRAEAARPFYEATASSNGSIAMRRHITLRMRQVVALEDEILNMDADQIHAAQHQGTITGEGALLASLSSRRTSKMTDIVATIQAEQDRIIRSPFNQVVVVQGGPGTGKTAVALHRAAYLLYTHRKQLSRSGVLVIGPSNSFLHYIDQVLPSLGETGVLSRTIATLLPGVHAQGVDDPHTAALKGTIGMKQMIANAVRGRERVITDLPAISIQGLTIPFRPADLEQAIIRAQRTHLAHNVARKTFVQDVIHTLADRYVSLLDEDSTANAKADAIDQLYLDDRLRKVLNLAWLPMRPLWLLDQLFSKPQQLKRYAPWLTERDIQKLARPSGSALTQSDVALLDEAWELLGDDPHDTNARSNRESRAAQEEYAKQTLQSLGISTGLVSSKALLDQMDGQWCGSVIEQAAADRTWTFGHIVVDEAQELTPMDWNMIVRRCPSRSLTIVGDVAQTASLCGARSWKQALKSVLGKTPWKVEELTINYRNPKEVSFLASAVASQAGLYVSTVKAVRSVPDAVKHMVVTSIPELRSLICEQVVALAGRFVNQDNTGRVAVICPADRVDSVRAAVQHALQSMLAPQEFQRLSSQNEWDRQIIVGTTQQTKGLEYDAVVLVQPGEIQSQAPSLRVAGADTYVAMTRCTQRLCILQTKDDHDSSMLSFD